MPTSVRRRLEGVCPIPDIEHVRETRWDQRALDFCITSFDESPPNLDDQRIVYGVYKQELAPTTRRPHWQCFVQFQAKTFPETALSLLGVPESSYIGAKHGTTEQAVAYCMKLDPLIGSKPIEKGTPVRLHANRGSRSDLKRLQDAVEKTEDPRDLPASDPAVERPKSRVVAPVEGPQPSSLSAPEGGVFSAPATTRGLTIEEIAEFAQCARIAQSVPPGLAAHVAAILTAALSAPATTRDLTPEDISEFAQRMRIARARAPSGLAADVASVLAAAPTIFAGKLNLLQAEGLLEGFLHRPKHSISKTLRSIPWEAKERKQRGLSGPTARDRELLCPVLTGLAKTLDEFCEGRNWERSVVCSDTTRRSALQQMILELRLSYPGEYMPSEAEKAASVLAQYTEIYEVFKDEAFVTTSQVHDLFRGELCLNKQSGQTAFEKAGPELWLALTKLIGYPSKPLCDYHGQFCVDHIVERSLYSRNDNRSIKTPGDTLTNYGMLIDAFNTADKMKNHGIEKRMWYTEKFSAMAKVAMGYRLDFREMYGRIPTTVEFVRSTVCKEAWQPNVMLLGRDHPVHRFARKRKAQGSLDGFVSSSRVGSVGVPNCVGEATVGA
jgi:hypothetical protein